MCGNKAQSEWAARMEGSPQAETFRAALGPVDAGALHSAMAKYRKSLSSDAPKFTTRKASQMALEIINKTLPTVRLEHSDALISAKGAYVLRKANGARDVTLIATGSEVEIALDAAAQLADKGVNAAVVSAPCFEAFAEQTAAYRASVLGNAPRVGVEAAIKQSWGALLGDNSTFIGMGSFGASAPGDDLYAHFGITANAVVNAANDLIKGN